MVFNEIIIPRPGATKTEIKFTWLPYYLTDEATRTGKTVWLEKVKVTYKCEFDAESGYYWEPIKAELLN